MRSKTAGELQVQLFGGSPAPAMASVNPAEAEAEAEAVGRRDELSESLAELFTNVSLMVRGELQVVSRE